MGEVAYNARSRRFFLMCPAQAEKFSKRKRACRAVVHVLRGRRLHDTITQRRQSSSVFQDAGKHRAVSHTAKNVWCSRRPADIRLADLQKQRLPMACVTTAKLSSTMHSQ